MITRAELASTIGLPWRIFAQFRNYQPQSVTIQSLMRWLLQFPSGLRLQIFLLLRHIIFVSRSQTEEFLFAGNNDIINRLESDSLGAENIIYVAVDSPGSSSGVMLNLVRDRQNMQARGARFVYINQGDFMTRYTSQLGTGAVVYVDDFCGSGEQFLKNRNHIAPFITGNFSEFFLLACICEEGKEKLEAEGVIPLAGLVHMKRDRPLHGESNILSIHTKQRLTDLADSMFPPVGLGFLDMAAMVVLERNAPDNVPMFLRGSPRQRPYRGLFPRWADLEIPENPSQNP